MKLRHNFLFIILSFVLILIAPMSTMASGPLDMEDQVVDYMSTEDLDEIMGQIIDYMNENANKLFITEGNNSTEETYIIELDNGDVIKSTISLEEIIEEENGLNRASGSKEEPAEPGRSYTLSWTIDRDGFLGGSFTHTMKFSTNNNLVNGYLYLNGTSCSINVIPPQLYTVKDKDSYFSTQTGRKIGTRSYVTLALQLSGNIIHYNSTFKVDLTGYSNYILVDYSHSML